jgi:hypothetical protein
LGILGLRDVFSDGNKLDQSGRPSPSPLDQPLEPYRPDNTNPDEPCPGPGPCPIRP